MYARKTMREYFILFFSLEFSQYYNNLEPWGKGGMIQSLEKKHVVRGFDYKLYGQVRELAHFTWKRGMTRRSSGI